MEMNLVLIGLVFLVLGYLVGVKKQTWLLAGYNEKRVKDKFKLARLVGSTMAILGILLLICGLIGIKQTEYLIMFTVAILLMEVVYVNAKMVE
ncbi:DUF3784 domain-containing protein [Rummeliibacillus sp. NPDC094406]|uniref:DUF3784 domain-containing protein n=1 Tax=Rummeliibacillus sp. NPDC094406 TaxID=3364511 RepID=UPI00380F1567